jgi:hypothetical protein
MKPIMSQVFVIRELITKDRSAFAHGYGLDESVKVEGERHEHDFCGEPFERASPSAGSAQVTIPIIG